MIKSFLLLVSVTGVLCINLSYATEKSGGYNRLVHEKSPYLQQHRNNPIWWYPWGDEAFDAARKLNRIVFLSIGYSTCHWCHVMERESFESEEVADLLNKHFIAIKVDREELPQVDQIYMTALRGMTGQGGWPMSMFLTPDGKPFVGATYLPKNQFVKLMMQIRKAWKQNPKNILKIGSEITEWISEQFDYGFANSPVPGEEVFLRYINTSLKQFDKEHGGFGRQPKFPHPLQLSLLLRIYKRSNNAAILQMVLHTVDAMARGGIHDQLGGGFHRYATDRAWLIPHFEKMLYVNALLAVSYLETYQLTKNPEFSSIAASVLDYLGRDMTHRNGGFYSAEDADSDGVEGRFYVWSDNELRKALTQNEYIRVQEVFHVSRKGNFELEKTSHHYGDHKDQPLSHGVNVLYLESEDSFPDREERIFSGALKKMFKIRNRRIRPFLDDKIIAAWNGLAITAMARGYQILGNQHYLESSIKAAEFVLKHLRDKNGRLLRRWRNGEAKFTAYLNDYAFLIQGLLDLYQSDFNPYWLHTALKLQSQQDRLFWDNESGGYFFSESSETGILKRVKIFKDSALPSGNAVAALNLLRLGDLTLNPTFRERAAKVISYQGLLMLSQPSSFSQMLIATDYLLDRSKEIVVVGKSNDNQTKLFINALSRTFLPNKVLVWSKELISETTIFPPLVSRKRMLNNRPTVYVCENNVCKLPTNDIKTMMALANQYRPFSF